MRAACRDRRRTVDVASRPVYVRDVKNIRPMGLHLSQIPADQLEAVKVAGWIQSLSSDCSTRLIGWAIRLKPTGELMTGPSPRRFCSGDMCMTAWTPAQFTTRKSARLAISEGLLSGSHWMQF